VEFTRLDIKEKFYTLQTDYLELKEKYGSKMTDEEIWELAVK
jgi:hypothetical protein